MEEQVGMPQEMPLGEEIQLPENTGAQESSDQISAEPEMDSTRALGASAKDNLILNNSLAFGAAAGHDMTANDSAMIITAVGHDLKLTDSAAGVLTVGSTVQMENGGAGLTFCREVTAQSATLGVVIAQQANLGEGSKVNMLVDWKQALVFGAAFGAVFALLGRLLRRK